jgi:hypothetical protein
MGGQSETVRLAVWGFEEGENCQGTATVVNGQVAVERREAKWKCEIRIQTKSAIRLKCGEPEQFKDAISIRGGAG